MGTSYEKNYILGLDIGSNSLGWAVITVDENNDPCGLAAAGVRVFNPGMIDLESANPETPAKIRRMARQSRRQTDRRRRRKLRIFKILKDASLLPEGENEKIIEKIDKEIYQKYQNLFSDKRQFAHVLPYFLRARALDERLDKHELGRAFYHLGQRRGFLSTRKELKKKEEYGKVKGGITDLDAEIKKAGARTLGEYFSKIDPEEQRIRDRYTSRQMYEDEFELIFSAQRKYYPQELNGDFKKRLYKALFRQRSFKPVRHLVGKCEYERNSKRCPFFRMEAQRFRIIQQLNNLKIKAPGELPRKLTDEERALLYRELDGRETVQFSDAKKLLNLKPKCMFTIEEGGEKRFKGNSTNAKMLAIFGEKWNGFSEKEREMVYQDLLGINNEETVYRRAKRIWKLDEEKAILFKTEVLDDGYCGLSLKALRKLLPLMEKGLTYPEAVKEAYGFFHHKQTVTDMLPQVDLALKDFKNPVVHRCLTELRRCVNAVIKKYGKPRRISVELARSIKSGQDERQRLSKAMRENEANRDRAREELMKKGLSNPSREDITKYLLAEECAWICPYTGKPINWENLFGPAPEFDIEHIIPLSVSLDDSFANKTLCSVAENRSVKRNKTPFEAYSGSVEKYDEIKLRVRKFTGKYKDEKLRRFMLENTDEFQDFTERHLNDTRYASKIAVEYLASLYGGVSDENGKRRIYCTRGPITAYVRRFYGLNSLLGGETKNRADHRHHAVDAVAIALADESTMQKLSLYAKKHWMFGRPGIKADEEPWGGFRKEAAEIIQGVIPIHHITNKVRGKLHADTIYGRCGEEGFVRIRKRLDSLTKAEIEKIADPYLKSIIAEKTGSMSDAERGKFFSNSDNLPVIKTGDNRTIKIKTVAIKKKHETFVIGDGTRKRNVENEKNHHMEIVAVLDEKGDETKWEGHTVSMFEAYMRKKRHEPIIRKDFGKGKRFKFSIFSGCMVEMEEKGKKDIFRIKSISMQKAKQVFYTRAVSAIENKEAKKLGEFFSKVPDTLRLAECRKVILTPLGDIRYEND